MTHFLMTYEKHRRDHDNSAWWHHYVVTGERGAVEFQYCIIKDFGHTAGLEVHWVKPPSFMDASKPSHENCPWLGKPCWHDGTSTYAQEHYVPLIELGETAIFNELRREYKSRFYEDTMKFLEESP